MTDILDSRDRRIADAVRGPAPDAEARCDHAPAADADPAGDPTDGHRPRPTSDPRGADPVRRDRVDDRRYLGEEFATLDLTVMGGRGHLVVHLADGDGAGSATGGGSAGAEVDPGRGIRLVELLELGASRLRELERRWSRFLPTSDVTRANIAAGLPVSVHADTIRAVTRALDGWHQTGGSFDITTLPALVLQGYTHSAVSATPAPLVHGTRIGSSARVVVDPARSTLTVPAGSAIDLGGIGKGLAADMVADELMAAGATGVLVNLGGDLTVRGLPHDDTSWYLGIEDPTSVPKHVALLRVLAGGVATSGTTVRKWMIDGRTRHHLIDPHTGDCADVGTLTATVLAADAATAEVFATAAMMRPPAEAVAMLHEVGLAGLIVATDGEVHRTETLRAYLA